MKIELKRIKFGLGVITITITVGADRCVRPLCVLLIDCEPLLVYSGRHVGLPLRDCRN